MNNTAQQNWALSQLHLIASSQQLKKKLTQKQRAALVESYLK